MLDVHREASRRTSMTTWEAGMDSTIMLLVHGFAMTHKVLSDFMDTSPITG
jgi:hypothetical protein